MTLPTIEPWARRECPLCGQPVRLEQNEDGRSYGFCLWHRLVAHYDVDGAEHLEPWVLTHPDYRSGGVRAN